MVAKSGHADVSEDGVFVNEQSERTYSVDLSCQLHTLMLAETMKVEKESVMAVELVARFEVSEVVKWMATEAASVGVTAIPMALVTKSVVEVAIATAIAATSASASATAAAEYVVDFTQAE